MKLANLIQQNFRTTMRFSFPIWVSDAWLLVAYLYVSMYV